MAAGSSTTRKSVSLDIASNVVERFQRAWGESPFYQSQLNGPAPDRFVYKPEDPYAADKKTGLDIARGRFTFGAHSIDCEGELERAWDAVKKGGVLHDYLHRFEWLRPLSALGEEGRVPAQALTRSWLVSNEKWSADAWNPFVTGERLVALCCHNSLVLTDADPLWRSRILASMARQTRHLVHSGHRVNGAYERLLTAMSLCVAAFSLPACEHVAARGLELLRRELRLQMRPDGGHLNRNPSKQLEIVCRLRMIEKALTARRIAIPGFLKHVLGRATAHLQLFRLGDGRLAVFNGGFEDDGRALSACLTGLDASTEPLGFARHSGFQRLEAGRTVLVSDVGASAPTGAVFDPFQSASSFHFTSGRSRLVVNCGAGARISTEWAKALRQATSHSTLSTDPAATMSALIRNGRVSHRRAEDGRGQLLEVSRTFLSDQQETSHIRRFFLDAEGNDLRGEDFISNPGLRLSADWRVRFHLHPAVRASIARDRRSVLLLLPNSEGWRFRTNCRHLSIQKSTYCGGGGPPAASEQIVLLGNGLEPPPAGDMVIKWGFRRIDSA